jgi:transposase
MDQVHVIRHQVLVEERSIRSVARGLGVSRNTVRKYLKSSEPKRAEKGPRARPVLDVVVARLSELLESWSPRTTGKQRLTATRLHRALREEGHEVGITTVRDYVREWRRQRAESFIPLVHRPGEEAQVDFFEVTIELCGQARTAWKFLLRLPYSGRDFVWIYDRCDQLSFLDGHVRAFAHFGGVPARLVYDNLSAAVKGRVGLERELTDRFRALASHYLFEPCFARPGEGHDKGSVESRGKGIRLQHLTPVPQGESLGALSIELLTEVDRVWSTRRRRDASSCETLWASESSRLGPVPAVAFEARHARLVQVSRQAMVEIEGSRYSVPSRWRQLEAMAYVGVEDIRLICRGEETTVQRVARGGRQVRYRHYLEELERKPQAMRQVASDLVSELGEPYDRLWRLLVERYGSKEAARVLSRVVGAVVEHGEKPVAAALESALAGGRADLLALEQRLERSATMPVPEALRGFTIEAPCAADFDALLVGGSR